MPAPQQQYYNFVAGSVALPNAAETVAATSRAVSSSYAACTFGILFVVTIATGAAATGVIFQVRRQSLTGTSIYGPETIAQLASVSVRYTVALTDQQAGEVVNAVYVLTASIQGGAAAGAATNAYSSVTVAE